MSRAGGLQHSLVAGTLRVPWLTARGACLLLLLIAMPKSNVFAEDWPQWRGPRGDGTSSETNIPTHWSASENVRWKTPIPGKGHSSPIVVGDRIFLTTCLEDQGQRVLLCLDRASGKLLWQRVVVRAMLEPKHNLNSYASATPAADQKHVWVAFFDIPRIELVCCDLDGREIWRCSPAEFHSIHGFCSSPVLYGNRVILNCDQDSPAASIVAFDKETGRELWCAHRPNQTRSYCTPIIRTLAGREQLILSGSKCVVSYDANTGQPIWGIDGPTEQFVASLVETDGIVFVTGGFPTYHLVAIDPSGFGNVSNSKVLWHDHRGAAYVPSPIAAGDYFYVASDDGIGSCWEARTGKLMWKHRLGPHHSASAVSAGGNLYFPADNGDTFVLKASPQLEMIGVNSLGEETHASPAISQGDLFIRTLHNLYCIR
ncbi:MAG TPA: PQQ-binding-like beta-propeller repeat protein [Tepidisphaeraceae bacterium]|nr:PQQ-binding-like beta-propeller repeat protein [Tepidisphaeraceae bacterium]